MELLVQKPLIKFCFYAASIFMIIIFSSLAISTEKIDFDDSFMFLRYARNFLDGYGFAWNRNEKPVYGCTSLLYLLQVTLFQKILVNFSESNILRLASFSSTLLSLTLFSTFLFLRLKQEALEQLFPFLFFLICFYWLNDPLFIYHSLTGMDTMLAFLTNTLFFLTVWNYIANDGSLLLIIVIGYLTFLARPENGIFFILFPLTVIYLKGKNWFNESIKFLGITAVFIIFDTIAKQLYFGSFVPLSYFAKKIGYAKLGIGVNNPILYLMQFLKTNLPAITIIILTFSWPAYFWIISSTISLFLFVSYFFSVDQIMGFMGRFYFPASPFILFPAIIMFIDFYSKNRNLKFKHILIFSFLCIILTKTLIAIGEPIAIWFEKTFPPPKVRMNFQDFKTRSSKPLPYNEDTYFQDMVDLVALFPASSSIACTEHGYLGAKFPHINLIDMTGLHDPIFAKNGFSASELLNRSPDFIFFPPPECAGIIIDIAGNTEFKRSYDYFPSAWGHGIAINRKSTYYSDIYKAVMQRWQEMYQNFNPEDYRTLQVTNQQGE